MGVAAGPALVGWAPSEALGLLAEFGVTLLLFAVGLKLDPQLTFSSTIIIVKLLSASARSTRCTGASPWAFSSCRTSPW